MFSGLADASRDREPGFPAALGEPAADAILIEEAVKGLAAWAGHGFGPDDAAGLMHGIDHMDVDHLQAGVEAVAAMPGIVTVHARAGTKPNWPRELPAPFPDRGANGKPRVLLDEIFVETADDRGRVRYEPNPDPPAGAVDYRAPVPSPPLRKGIYRTGTYCPLVLPACPGGHRGGACRICGLADGARPSPPGAHGPAHEHRYPTGGRALAAVGGGGRGTGGRRSCSRRSSRTRK